VRNVSRTICYSTCDSGGQHIAHTSCYTYCIKVMESPLRRQRPTGSRLFFLVSISTASSKTTFMYSSNPIMIPSMNMRVSSYNQRRTRVFFCAPSKKHNTTTTVCESRNGVGPSMPVLLIARVPTAQSCAQNRALQAYLQVLKYDIDRQCHYLFYTFRRHDGVRV
jgi:hypothetical protein